MKKNRSTRLLFVALCLTIACILQAIALARYVGRLPDDWVGIGLYSAALVGFAVAAIGFFIQWQSEKDVEKRQRLEEQGK